MLATITPVFGYADAVLDFFNSGAGPIDDQPYGGTYDGHSGDYPVPISLKAALGPDEEAEVDFVSLPTGSWITLGFLDEVVVDGEGDDIFVTEVSFQSEDAQILISSNGVDFTLLGIAGGGQTASFDLADIGFAGVVTAVKIVGLDVGGGSPGFDVVNLRVTGVGSGVDLDEDNDLAGSDGDDKVDLKGGDDSFEAGRGDDEIHGGAGEDQINGGGGRDRLNGGGGGDRLSGQGGDDALEGGGGHDALFGGRGDDDLEGGQGRDALEGGGGRDRLAGGGGGDQLSGGGGGDRLIGGGGADALDGGAGKDRLWGGKGDDRFRFETGDGFDRIMDFSKGDLIDLSGHDDVGRFRALKQGFEDVKAGLRIHLGDDQILALGLDADDLSRDDFIL